MSVRCCWLSAQLVYEDSDTDASVPVTFTLVSSDPVLFWINDTALAGMTGIVATSAGSWTATAVVRCSDRARVEREGVGLACMAAGRGSAGPGVDAIARLSAPC